MSDKTALIQIDPPSIIKIHDKPIRSKLGEQIGLIPGTAIVPVVREKPPKIDGRTHYLQKADPVVKPDAVVEGWGVLQRPQDQVVASIKTEAEKVITDDERLPFWKQMNLAAASLESLDDRLNGGDGNPQYEAIAKAAKAWIAAVRAESNAKEAALLAGEPIDLDAWPEYPL